MAERIIRVAALIIALSLLVSVGNGYAFAEPDGFRGVKWGATVDEAKATILGLGCGTRTCFGELDMAGQSVTAMLDFRDGGFYSVYLRFGSSRFEALKPLFVERYGAPTHRRSERVQANIGGKSENEILEWSGQKVYIRLQRYAGRLKGGSARIMTQAGRAEELRKFHEQLKRGKNDL
jgi:hypothetical protein